MNKKQEKVQPDKLSDQLEQLWDDLLSRQPDRIWSAFESLEAAGQKTVLAHLRRMVKEDGWQHEQRVSARAAIKIIAKHSKQD